jgi:hypothetical protein
MKTSTKLIVVGTLLGTLGLAGVARFASAGPAQSPYATIPEQRDNKLTAQTSDKETNDDTKAKAGDHDKEANDDTKAKAGDHDKETNDDTKTKTGHQVSEAPGGDGDGETNDDG